MISKATFITIAIARSLLAGVGSGSTLLLLYTVASEILPRG